MRVDGFTRARIGFAVLIGLIVFLLGSLYHQSKERASAVQSLQRTNQTVVDKLAEVLERTIRAEQAALNAQQTPSVRIEDVLTQVKGIDQALIDQALQKAYRAVSTNPGPPGPPGPAGPPGTTVTTRPAPTTTTTAAPGGTTTSTQPQPTSTTTSTTTTTRPCAVGLLGVCLIGGT